MDRLSVGIESRREVVDLGLAVERVCGYESKSSRAGRIYSRRARRQNPLQ